MVAVNGQLRAGIPRPGECVCWWTSGSKLTQCSRVTFLAHVHDGIHFAVANKEPHVPVSQTLRFHQQICFTNLHSSRTPVSELVYKFNSLCNEILAMNKVLSHLLFSKVLNV